MTENQSAYGTPRIRGTMRRNNGPLEVRWMGGRKFSLMRQPETVRLAQIAQACSRAQYFLGCVNLEKVGNCLAQIAALAGEAER